MKPRYTAKKKERINLIKLLHSMYKIKKQLINDSHANRYMFKSIAFIGFMICLGGCASYYDLIVKKPIKTVPEVVQVEQKPELPDLSKTMPYVPLADIGKPEANPIGTEPIKINVKHVKTHKTHITPKKPTEPIKSIESKELDNQKEVVRKSLGNTFKWLVSIVLVFLGIIYIAHKRIK